MCFVVREPANITWRQSGSPFQGIEQVVVALVSRFSRGFRGRCPGLAHFLDEPYEPDPSQILTPGHLVAPEEIACQLYDYDPLDRQTFAGFGATGSPPSYASTIAMTYDAGNRATEIVDSVAGTIERTYDLLDRELAFRA